MIWWTKPLGVLIGAEQHGIFKQLRRRGMRREQVLLQSVFLVIRFVLHRLVPIYHTAHEVADILCPRVLLWLLDELGTFQMFGESRATPSTAPCIWNVPRFRIVIVQFAFPSPTMTIHTVNIHTVMRCYGNRFSLPRPRPVPLSCPRHRVGRSIKSECSIAFSGDEERAGARFE